MESVRINKRVREKQDYCSMLSKNNKNNNTHFFFKSKLHII
jgi:hypothetical protein